MNASITSVDLGAAAGLLAAIGVVVMTIVYVRHARQIRLLRRWAGSRPELRARAHSRVAHDPLSVPERVVLRQAHTARTRLRARTLAPRVGAGVAALAVITVAVLAYPRHDAHDPISHGGWVSRPDPRPGQIRVLNATNVAGLAAAAAARLQRAGLHVVGIGDAPHSASSRIAAGADDRPAALRAARLLDVGAITHSLANDAARGVDIVVTVGRDTAAHPG